MLEHEISTKMASNIVFFLYLHHEKANEALHHARIGVAGPSVYNSKMEESR